ncbi:MAG: helix-turn-helix transcriptional regulator [Clostridia bacterium]|nr:helix-turn-helix transcriptional regulator [Clostridia bacterium]
MHAEFGLTREQKNQLSCSTGVRPYSRLHFHSQIELCLVEEGAVEVWVNDRHRIMKKGEFSVALSYDAHGYLGKEEGKACFLIIPTDLCGEFLAAVQNKRMGNPFLADPEVFSLLLDCGYQLKERPNKVKTQGLIYLILGTLLDCMELEERSEAVDPKLSSNLLIYINENLKNDLSLGAVAAALGYHPASLSRYFKNCFQMPFNRYVTLVRLRQAVLLMKESKHSIVYCADESGFNSVRTFYRVFQAEFGCTPKEYLKTACNPT